MYHSSRSAMGKSKLTHSMQRYFFCVSRFDYAHGDEGTLASPSFSPYTHEEYKRTHTRRRTRCTRRYHSSYCSCRRPLSLSPYPYPVPRMTSPCDSQRYRLKFLARFQSTLLSSPPSSGSPSIPRRLPTPRRTLLVLSLQPFRHSVVIVSNLSRTQWFARW